jgi:hypothetical protein
MVATISIAPITGMEAPPHERTLLGRSGPCANVSAANRYRLIIGQLLEQAT